jgi:hypothetical protein
VGNDKRRIRGYLPFLTDRREHADTLAVVCEDIPVRARLSIRVPKMAQFELCDAKTSFINSQFNQRVSERWHLAGWVVLHVQGI